jgi:hypothetical protein
MNHVVRHLCISFLLAAPLSAFASGITAFGAAGSETDWSTFITAQNSGEICVAVRVANSTNDPGAGAGNRCAIKPSLFAFALPTLYGTAVRDGKLPDVTTISNHADSVTAGGTKASGDGRWSYISRTTLDSADYIANTSITPAKPTTWPNYARARSEDPIVFDSNDPGVLGLSLTLSEIAFDLAAGVIDENTSTSFTLGFGLDGQSIVSLDIGLVAGGAAPTVLLDYTSILGKTFDSTMKNTIMSALVVDPALWTLSLDGPVEIFPRTEIPYSAGSHVFSGGIGVAVEAPAPATVFLIIAGLAVSGAVRLSLICRK